MLTTLLSDMTDLFHSSIEKFMSCYLGGNLYSPKVKFPFFTAFFRITQKINSEFVEMSSIGISDGTVGNV